MKIVFATGNAHKLQEVNDIAKGSGVEFILPPKDFNPIENGTTFEENSYIKALEASKLSGMIALADDSGLCVEALNDAPGIYSARYAETPQARIDNCAGTYRAIHRFSKEKGCMEPYIRITCHSTDECRTIYKMVRSKQGDQTGKSKRHHFAGQ